MPAKESHFQKKTILATMLAVLLLPAVSPGHDEPPKPGRYTPAEQYKATPLPDRIILTWSGDPTTSINVTWRTDLDAGQPRLQIAPAETLVGELRGPNPAAREVQGTSEPFECDLGKSLYHSVLLEDLKPGSMYVYRVGDGEYFSEWFQFRTASAESKPFEFVYFGDSQNEVRSLWSRIVREANLRAPRASFMLHAGDLINNTHSDGEWGEWFGAGGWLNGMIPSIACPGNHEYRGGLDPHWRPQFAFPLNGPAGLEETAYYLDYQGARIISLNSNENLDVQREWLEGVLKQENRPKWTFVTFHHPIFSAAKNRDNPELRNNWQPILENYGVDLVLQGHDHAYARSGLGGPRNVNVPEGVTRKHSNTVYVVSVSGPKMYDVHESWEVSRVASGLQLFQIIRVSQDRIRYEARTATGELYDAFSLVKDEQGRSQLTEEIPDVPESRVTR